MKDLRERFREAYFAAECPWEQYRWRTGDHTDGRLLEGTEEKDRIANLWKAFDAVYEEWLVVHPLKEGEHLGVDVYGYPSPFVPAKKA